MSHGTRVRFLKPMLGVTTMSGKVIDAEKGDILLIVDDQASRFIERGIARPALTLHEYYETQRKPDLGAPHTEGIGCWCYPTLDEDGNVIHTNGIDWEA